MTLGKILYQFFIGPLELIFEVVFGLAKTVVGSSGLSIIALSLAVNVLLLPLYRRADAIQSEERAKEQSLSRWVGHIRKTFRGDERSMMLQTYYRQNGYKPIHALKGSLPLLLEIPFFIAAYHFLSNLEELNGLSFGPIQDLGAPDTLLTIGSLQLHLLPILMTLINFVSSAIYAKGFSLKDKIKLYGMALIFLILLYESPAGLVFYWTLNNLFSLGKNLFGRMKDPGGILRILLAVLGLGLAVFAGFFYPAGAPNRILFLLLLAACMELPLILRLLRKPLASPKEKAPRKSDSRLFLCGCIFLALLTGVLIPSAVVASSPEEFVHVQQYYSPYVHVLNAALLSFGLFVLWMGVFYFITSEKSRWIFDYLIVIVSVAAILNYMFFGGNLGTLSQELKYDLTPEFSSRAILINIASMVIVAAAVSIIYFRRASVAKIMVLMMALAVIGMSAVNMSQIGSSIHKIEESVVNYRDEKAHFTLSKNGKNVIVFMLDRAISRYLPYLFQEKPELLKQFDGFTYYPNTVSFGGYTNFATPALYGGYEYTPEQLNKRADEALVDKHNEALKVMPVLFDEADFEVTVCDPVYAGYTWRPNLAIYDDYPDIQTFVTEQGQFSLLTEENAIQRLDRIWEQTFFAYAIMKCSPLVLQPILYHGGTYFIGDTQREENISRAVGTNTMFNNSYAALQSLPYMTEYTSARINTFLIISNCTTHEPALLQEPEYIPLANVDNEAYDAAHKDRFNLDGRVMRVATMNQMKHYQSNMAAYIKLGQWFDYLRENGVYDNTRIIIVADHGRDLGQFDDMIFGLQSSEDAMLFNPLFLVKDFNASGFVTDNRFMTNAEVPALAMEGLIEDPVNPFTGQAILQDFAEKTEPHILLSHIWNPSKNNGNTFKPGSWYSVHDDIFSRENWKKLGEY